MLHGLRRIGWWALVVVLADWGAVGAVAAPAYTLPPLGGTGPKQHHPGKIIWADLVTPDLERAERFYGDLFGWTFRTIHAGSADYAVALADGRPIAGLLQRSLPPTEHKQPAWLTFIAVRDVDATCRDAVAHGAVRVSAPKTYPGRGRQAVLADPQGAVFAVLASAGGDLPDTLAQPGEWIWSALLTDDVGPSAAFYQNLFGYEVYDTDSDDGAEHVILSSDQYARASVNSLPRAGRRHPHWLDFVRVPDATAAAHKAETLGGRILVQPHDDGHGGKAAVVADPSGAPLGVMDWPE